MMKSFRLEPFLWIHFVGIAVLPLFLELTWLGLSVGDPLPLSQLELLLVAIAGIIPVLWMQWRKPFDIFSVLLVSLAPEQLTEERRKILSLFKLKKQRIISAIAALVMVLLLWQLEKTAPLAATATASVPQWRILGLFWASLAFAGSNLFLQIPLSVLGVILNRQERFLTIESYPTERISSDFTVPGWRVGRLFTFLSVDT